MENARLLLVDLDALDGPVAPAGAIDPVLKEIVPGVPRVRLEFALKGGHAKDAELILAIDAAHEIEERGLAHTLLDQADDLAAPIVRRRGEVGEMAVFGHFLN